MTAPTDAQSSAARPALIVLGMHRSGTSALAGVLGQMGMGLPQELMAPREMNARGFFESNVITQLNEDLLASAGMTWWEPQRFPDDWLHSDAARAFAARARAALRAEFGDSGPFVLKDPRLCRLMPFWLPVLRDAGCRPLIVLTHRHPDEVAASLQRWAGYDVDYASLLWLRHLLDAEAGTRGEARCFTSFAALLADWRATVISIGRRLDLHWPRDVEAAAPEVQAFLSQDLRHFDSRQSAASQLSDWIGTTLTIMNNWAQGGEKAQDHATLDALRRGLDRAEATFLPMVRKAQALTQETRHLRDHIGTLDAEVQRVKSDLTGALDANAAHEQAGARMRQQIEALEIAAEDSRAALDIARSALAQRGQENDDLYAQLGVQTARIAQAEASLRHLRDEHAVALNRLAKTTGRLDRLTASVSARMRAELDRRLTELAHPTPPASRRDEQPEAGSRSDPSPGSAADGQERLDLQQQLEAERNSARALQLQVDALLDSTSWRVTGPMRRLSGLVRRIRRN